MQANIDYGPKPGEQGDLFLPAGSTDPLPLVVLIHGGGMIEGSRGTGTGLARVIAGQGLAVFNIDYRLAKADDAQTHWPAQLLDAQLAVRFVRAHAAEWRVDPARLGAMGDSAGGQLAMFLGVLPAPVTGDVAGLFAAEPNQVQAVVDEFGPMDLSTMPAVASATFMGKLFGVPNPSPAELKTASPLPAITAHAAPTYIIQGTQDQIVPFDQSRRLADLLKDKGVPRTLVSYAGGHEFKGLSDEEAGHLQVGAIAWLLARLRRS